jgi:YVTN family beta-propeller protein
VSLFGLPLQHRRQGPRPKTSSALNYGSPDPAQNVSQQARPIATTAKTGLSAEVLRMRTATIGASLVAVAALVTGGMPMAAAQDAAPKAYVGLFGDNAVTVVDTATNQVTKTVPIPTGPHGLVITPDNKWVYASSDGDSVVSVINTTTDEVSSSIDVGTMPHGLAITPDGSRVLVAGFGTDQVEAIDTGTNQVVWKVPVPQPHNLAITADGQTAYAASQKTGSQALAIIDIPSGAQTGSVPLDHTPRALNVSPDGHEVFFTEAGVDALLVLDRASNQIVSQIPTGASPHHPLFTPDGKLGMVVAQGPGELDLFDPETYASTDAVKVGDMPHWIAATSDNHFAYVTNEVSNNVSVVDLTSSKVTDTIPVGNAPRKIVVQSGNVPVSAGAQPAPSGPAKSSSAPQTPAPAVVADQGQSAVSIAKFAFVPATITISAGQSITWTNTDPVAHTATSDDKVWDSGNLSPNASFTTTFSQPGTYAYHCTIHPFIRGTVVVQ